MTSPVGGAVIALLVFVPILVVGNVLPLGAAKAIVAIVGALGVVSAVLVLILCTLGSLLGLHKRADAVVREGRSRIVFPGFRPTTPRVRALRVATPAPPAAHEPIVTEEPQPVDLRDSPTVDLREPQPVRVRLTK